MKVGGILFGGIFFLAGLAAFYFLILSTLFDAFQMQFWQSTPAELKRAEISTYESRNDSGSYTTMYSVDLMYEYWAEGRMYMGTRSNIREDSSSDSDEHYQRLYKIKQEASQKRLRVWVNPNDQTESIYDRTINIKFTLIMTLFTAVFMFIGGSIAYVSRKKDKPLPLGTTPDSSKPWTTRAEWASPTLHSNAKNKIGIIKFFTILSFLFFGMFALALFGTHPVATTFSFILCLPPFFLFRWYKKTKREWDYFDKVPMQLNPHPGVIGGKVAGSILVPTSYTSGDQYTLELKCTHHWITRSGNESKSHSAIIWSNKISPTPKSKVNGSYLTFDFNVPASKPASSKPDNNYHNWTLNISSELKGINFNREYEIPVFVTQDSNTVKDELEQKPLTAQQKADLQTRLSINMDRNTHGRSSLTDTHHTSPQQSMSLHTPGSTDGWLIGGIGTVFFIIGLLIATVAESFFGFVFSSMATVFIGFGIYILGRNCQIRVTPNRLEVDVFLFSKLIKQHRLTLQDIKEIKAHKSSSSSQNGQQVTEKYSLRLFTTAGKLIDLGGEFKTMKNATHIQLEIEAVLAGTKKD
ncbi:MAG: DUF3592 domain-containing protein [Gammaproteobacteria bacterium]|nr:DUF3592 domain-containing protein [Gammaproteobacteria bacterium]